MEHLTYEVLGSSSKGNCVILEKFLMLDCGVSYAKIKKHLNEVKVIFISHIHKDHLLPTTIKKIAYEKPTIKFICGNGSVAQALKENGVQLKNINYLRNNVWYNFGAFNCMVQEVTHDAENNCLHIEIRNKKALYVVDTKHVDNIVAKGYDTYLVEGNYETETLKENKKKFDENFEYDYLYRVENTHLSVEQAMDFLISNMSEDSQYQLIHQSSLNIKKEETSNGEG